MVGCSFKLGVNGGQRLVHTLSGGGRRVLKRASKVFKQPQPLPRHRESPLQPVIADTPLRFDRFELRPAERVLRVQGEPVALGSRAFDLLLVLAQRHERLVTKQELLDLVWPGLVVEEHNIATQISTLRKLLGAGVITTLPGYGYRLTAARTSVPKLPAVSTPSAATAPLPHNLPEPRTRFIGREAALADLARLLPSTRLLTL